MKLLDIRKLEEDYKISQEKLEQEYKSIRRKNIFDFIEEIGKLKRKILSQGKIKSNNEYKFFDWQKVGFGRYGNEPLYGFTNELHRKYVPLLGAPDSYLDLEHTIYKIKDKGVIKSIEKLSNKDRIGTISALAGGFPHNAPVDIKTKYQLDSILQISIWGRVLVEHEGLFNHEEALSFIQQIGFLNKNTTKYSDDFSH